MAPDKLNVGDNPRNGPLNTNAWNSVIESRDDYQQRSRLKVTSQPGNGKPYRPSWQRNWHTVVQVRNESGTSLRSGDCIEFSGSPLTIRSNDAIWLTGVAVNATRFGWGIAVEPIVYDASALDIGQVLVVGACVANVLVRNESHEFAERVSGSHVLRSCAHGQVRILYKPTGSTPPEERECFVQIGDRPGVLLGKTDAAISKGSSGTVSIWSGTPGSETDTGDNITAFNRFANLGSGKWVACTPINGHYYLTSAEC